MRLNVGERPETVRGCDSDRVTLAEMESDIVLDFSSEKEAERLGDADADEDTVKEVDKGSLKVPVVESDIEVLLELVTVTEVVNGQLALIEGVSDDE